MPDTRSPTESIELFTQRVLLAVVAVAVPLFGLLAHLANPERETHAAFRLAVAGTSAALFAGSYGSPWFARRLRGPTIAVAAVIQGVFGWIGATTGMADSQEVGVLLITAGSLPLFSTPRALAAYGAFSIAIQVVGYAVSDVVPVVPLPLVVATQVVVFVSVGTVLIGRQRLEEALQRARTDLEQRVNLRTGALVTSLAQLEAEVRERAAAEERAEAANRTKSAFLANISHELRTPLNAILGYAELMREEFDERGEDASDVERIHAAGRHLLQMINDVLDLSRIEAGKLKLVYGRVDLHDVVSRVVHMVEAGAQQRNNRIVVEVGSPFHLRSDRVRLEQILVNLVSNAVKFTEGGEVRIAAERVEGWVVVRVTDTGIGIPEHAIGSLFQKFVQIDGSSTRKHGGTGLGLALVRELSLRLGGRVDVVSREGVGSTFTVHLPSEEEEALLSDLVSETDSELPISVSSSGASRV